MNNKTANPTALGYASIFITGWLFSMSSAGWFGLTSVPELGLITGLYLGGIVAALTGIFLYFRGDTLDMSLFIGFGAFVFIIATFNMSAADGSVEVAETFGGMFNILWAVYFAFLWLANRRNGGIKSWFLLGLALTILLHGVAYFTSMVLIMIGGYVGLVTSILAAYISYSEIKEALEPGHTHTRSSEVE